MRRKFNNQKSKAVHKEYAGSTLNNVEMIDAAVKMRYNRF